MSKNIYQQVNEVCTLCIPSPDCGECQGISVRDEKGNKVVLNPRTLKPLTAKQASKLFYTRF